MNERLKDIRECAEIGNVVASDTVFELLTMIDDIDKQFCKWMDVVDEMSIGRGEHTVDFYVLGDNGKTVIEPRKVEGIYEAMRQHFSTYRTTRVERAEHENYSLTKRIEELEACLSNCRLDKDLANQANAELEAKLEAIMPYHDAACELRDTLARLENES